MAAPATKERYAQHTEIHGETSYVRATESDVRVVAAIIEHFEHLSDLELPLEPVTVLFGKNGAGKSTVMRALEEGWGGRAPADVAVDWVAELDEDDAWVLRDILSNGASRSVGLLEGLEAMMTAEMRAAFERLERSVPEPSDFRSLVDLIAERLRTDLPASRPDTELLIESLLSRPLIRFSRRPRSQDSAVPDVLRSWMKGSTVAATLVADRPPENSVSQGAWARVAGSEVFDDSALGCAARERVLESSRFVSVLELGRVDETFAYPSHNQMVGFMVIPVEREPAGLADFLESSMRDLFHATIGVDDADSDSPLKFEQPGGQDPWLELLEDEPGAFRLRRGLNGILELVAEWATGIAPTFVQDAGRVRIAANEPSAWPAQGRISLLFEASGRRYRLDQLGTGTARWVAASVREAVRQIVRSRRFEVLNPETGSIWTVEPDEPYDALADVIYDNFLEPPRPQDVMLSAPRDPGILLIDEPELHLHPQAQADVSSWLEQRVREGLTVVLATHSPAFLGPGSAMVGYAHVRGTPAGPVLDHLGSGLVSFLHESASDAGMTRADLLLVLRGLLVLEGHHDLLVVRHFFSGMLDEARVLPVRLQGTGNATALIESDFVGGLGLPVRVIFDNVASRSIERDANGRKPSDEARRARALLQLAEEVGRDIQVIPYDEPDVICALPEAAVRKAYPDSKFDAWDPLVDRFRQLALPNFKQWALVQMGVTNVAPTDFIKRVLAFVEPGDSARPAFSRAIREAVAAFERAS